MTGVAESVLAPSDKEDDKVPTSLYIERVPRFRRHLVWWLSLLFLVVAAACAPVVPGAGKGAEGGTDEETKEKVDVDLAPVDRGDVAAAKRALAENYEAFLEREPMGFERATLDRLGPELQRAWRRGTRGVGVAADTGFRNSIPLLVVALFLVGLALLDRQSWRLAMRAQGRTQTGWWDWLTTWARIGIAVAGRSAPVTVLVGLSYFPVQAVFGRAGWTLALTSLLWLLLAYRAILTVVEAVFAFGLVPLSDEHADKLERFAQRALLLIFGFLALLVLATHLEVADDVRSLIVFAYEIALLFVPLYLLFIKPSVMALFPEPDEGGVYERLRRGIDRYFRVIVVVSILLLALRAIGYVNAATFILLRGYGLFLLVMAVVAGGARVRRWFRARIAASSEEHRDLYRSVEWALRVASILLITWASLSLFALWEPLVILLETPLLTIGDAAISMYSILKSALLFLVAILIARVVRAVLVIRVFPAFGVDVGVGYAVQTLVSYALIVVGFFIALIALGVNLSAMTVVLASLGVGIGFGLQTLTENLISGFILLFGRSVKKGDIVTVGDTYGQVEAVGARSVLIKTADNYDMLIPSKEIVGGRIINWSYENGLIRHKIPVGVSYNANPREVQEALLDAASRHEFVLDEPKPEVWLKGFGDNSVDFTLLVWFDCRAITRDRLGGTLYFHIWDALHERGIEIPFPQRDLHLKSIDFPLQGVGGLRKLPE